MTSTLTATGPPPPPPAHRGAGSVRPRGIARVPRWLRRTVLVGLIAAGIVLGVNGAVAIVAGFALLTPLELLFPRHDQPVRRPGLRADLVHLVLTPLLQTAAFAVPVVILYVVLQPFVVRGIQGWITGQPVMVQLVLGFAVFELAAYWIHRLAHEIPFFWRFHAVHHSSEALDWLAAVRLHPFDGVFLIGLAAVPLIVLGFQPVEVAALTLLANLWAISLHMNVRWRLRWLDGIVGTTEWHHWHHSAHPDARDKNYSGLLPVLDRVFGTYYLPDDRRPEVYGTDEPVPDTYLGQLAFPFRRHRREWQPF